MTLKHLENLTLPEPHPLAGREAFHCTVCNGISYAAPDAPCPYCADDEEDDPE